FVAVVTAVWTLSKTSQRLNSRIDASKLDFERRLAIKSDDAVAKFGETVRAIREKISEMELWNRDHFVNRQTFDATISQTSDTLPGLEDKIEARFDKLDEKLSKMSGE